MTIGSIFATFDFMKAPEVIRLLKADGWCQDRQKGSHRIFKHATKGGIVVLPDHRPKDIPPGTLNSILKQAGLK